MLQLRISSGIAKNKKLKLPEIQDFRPVQEIVKQAIFAILADDINGAVCLDLFAGTGNLGLEAISRGAKWCDFVDNHPEAEIAIEQNTFACGFADQTQVIRKEAAKYAAKTDKTYDIIFIDPFYKDTAQIYLVKQVERILNPNGTAFILYGDQLNLDTIISGTNLEVATTRKFGATRFSVLKHGKLAN